MMAVEVIVEDLESMMIIIESAITVVNQATFPAIARRSARKEEEEEIHLTNRNATTVVNQAIFREIVRRSARKEIETLLTSRNVTTAVNQAIFRGIVRKSAKYAAESMVTDSKIASTAVNQATFQGIAESHVKTIGRWVAMVTAIDLVTATKEEIKMIGIRVIASKKMSNVSDVVKRAIWQRIVHPWKDRKTLEHVSIAENLDIYLEIALNNVQIITGIRGEQATMRTTISTIPLEVKNKLMKITLTVIINDVDHYSN